MRSACLPSTARFRPWATPMLAPMHTQVSIISSGGSTITIEATLNDAGNGIEVMTRIARELVAATDLPVAVQANAGLPETRDGAIVYRLAAPEADHYFLINDGPATTVQLDTRKLAYETVVDAVTGEQLALGSPIDLPAHDGRWLRFGK